jgi:ankyrin repeat protein
LKEIYHKQLFIITQKDVFTGDSLLHYAIFDNKTEFVKHMIELFENEINMKNEDGNTPLHYACIRGNLEIVKLLHSKGALVSERNTDYLTPLLLSIYYSHFFVVHYLLSIEIVIDFVSSNLFELYRVF